MDVFYEETQEKEVKHKQFRFDKRRYFIAICVDKGRGHAILKSFDPRCCVRHILLTTKTIYRKPTMHFIERRFKISLYAKPTYIVDL